MEPPAITTTPSIFSRGAVCSNANALGQGGQIERRAGNFRVHPGEQGGQVGAQDLLVTEILPLHVPYGAVFHSAHLERGDSVAAARPGVRKATVILDRYAERRQESDDTLRRGDIGVQLFQSLGKSARIRSADAFALALFLRPWGPA